MIDYAARKQMAATARAYLNDGICVCQCLDDIGRIADKSDDCTVQTVAEELCDWCEDDRGLVDKSIWDYVYRLLLILESDAEVEIETIRNRSPRQLIAACALAIFGVLALLVGWGPQLFALSIAFGPITLLLSVWSFLATPKPEPLEAALTPFSSISELLRARRRVPCFSKTRYARHVTIRNVWAVIWSPFWVIHVFLFLYVIGGALRVVFAPVVLLSQCMPETTSRMRVRIPE